MFLKTSQQFVPYFLRNDADLRSINIGKENQAPKQHLPVRLKQRLQAIPIQAFAAGTDQVRDIGGVEALAP
ncbi:MAG TPA: hypothetical protein VHB45_15020 [Alloacidobacterium sp.]|nr:hypothetical protein [Alloacidobacterium sp.]